MKLENVVGLVGGASALAGCLLPFAATGATAGQSGSTGLLLYAAAGIGLLASLAGLSGKWRREEVAQVLAGSVGLGATLLLHRNVAGAGGWALQLLYWGFAMLLAEGLIHFGERPRAAAAR